MTTNEWDKLSENELGKAKLKQRTKRNDRTQYDQFGKLTESAQFVTSYQGDFTSGVVRPEDVLVAPALTVPARRDDRDGRNVTAPDTEPEGPGTTWMRCNVCNKYRPYKRFLFCQQCVNETCMNCFSDAAMTICTDCAKLDEPMSEDANRAHFLAFLTNWETCKSCNNQRPPRAVQICEHCNQKCCDHCWANEEEKICNGCADAVATAVAITTSMADQVMTDE